jgi:hypothetical protein
MRRKYTERIGANYIKGQMVSPPCIVLYTSVGDMSDTIRNTKSFWAVLLFLSAPIFAQQPPKGAHNISKYLGPGSCSAAACHGNIAPQKTTSVQQNEYSTWVVQDRHAAAFRALQNPVSQRMGKLLGIGNPEESPRCLTCHALSVPAGAKGREFSLGDGVSCESCHGPSSEWLGNHTTKGWSRQKSIAAGMVDNWDIEKRAQQCLSCHLGDEKRYVDHEMIAAGHPDLVFDLESYTAAMPPHWRPEADSQVLRTWSVGQAVQLRESLQRLSRRAGSGGWPEYSEFECYACHHNLVAADRSWRQRVGYTDRKPGDVPWNAAHFAVLRIIVKETEPELSEDLEKGLTDVFRLTSDRRSDRRAIANAAKHTAAATDQLAQKFKTRNFQRDEAVRILNALSSESVRLSNMGPKTAEQATMAVQSLAVAAPNAARQKDFDAALKVLYKQIENPSNYNAGEFAEQYRRTISVLR